MKRISLIIASLCLSLFSIEVCAFSAFAEPAEDLLKYQEEVQRNPRLIEARLNLGKAYVDLEHWQKAAEEFQKTVLIDPNDTRAHNNLGFAYENLHRYGEAVAEYKEAIRLDPANIKAHKNLGWLYTAQGLWQEAIAEHKAVLQVNPNDTETRKFLALSYRKLEHSLEALAEYQEATSINPNIPMAHFNIGKANSYLGRWVEALIEFGVWAETVGQYSATFSLDANLIYNSLDTVQIFSIASILSGLLFLSLYLLAKASRAALDFKQKQHHHSLSNPAYRPDIDGLRAIAVLSVVAFHARWRGVPGGFVGVDIFFVISGYLISSILFKNLESGSFSFFDFYSRRIKRIFPALIAVLLTVWGTGWFVLLGDEYKSLGKHIFSSAVFLQNLTLWREAGYFDTASDFKPLLHLWSLGVEEQYYIIWPLLLYFCWKRKINTLLLLCSVALASFALNVGQIGKHAMATFYLPHTRFWELMLGGVLAYSEVCKNNLDTAQLNRFAFNISFPQKFRDNFKNIKACLGFSLIIGAVLFLDKSKAYPGWWALIPIAGAFLLISAGRGAWVNRNILANPVMVFIGLISYPLYLWHWSLLSLVRIEFASPPHALEIVAIVVSFFLSWVTYEYLEKPVRFGKFSRTTKTVPVALIIFIMCAALIGAETYRAEGFISRFPTVVQHLANYPSHFEKYREGKCFMLHPEKTDTIKFDSDCVDPENDSKPLVLLWGNSLAAHLYPGLKSLQNTQDFRLAQFTVRGCLPLFYSRVRYENNFDEFCWQFNDYVAKEIIKLKPKTVILSGGWHPDEEGIAEQVDETVVFLKKSGVKQIILVGPTPTWNPTLPKALFSFFKNDPIHRLPGRMWQGLDLNISVADKALHEKANRLGIIYLSPFDELCNADGCLTRVGNNADDLLTWDSRHFTSSGSRFFINRVFANLPLT